MTAVRLSVLDLIPVRSDQSTSDALAATTQLAQAADRMEPLLTYAWRRHLFGASRENLAPQHLILYPDGMVEHDGHVGQLLKKLDDLGIKYHHKAGVKTLQALLQEHEAPK